MENKDYTKLTLEDLLIEEKKIKRNELTSSVIIGVLIGVIVLHVRICEKLMKLFF